MSEIRVIIGGPEPNVEGSREYPCAFCGQTVYLAPGGQCRLAEDTELAVICQKCADAFMAKSDVVVSQPADLDELVRELMRGMGSIHYILIDRKPVLTTDYLAWMMWMDRIENFVVRQERIGPYEVSTVFLGMDHRFREGPPVLFETMVFLNGSGVSVDYQTRCSTWEEAEAMHDAAAEATRRMISG